MAKVKAIVSFAGEVTMGQGDIVEISDAAVAADLASAGYVEIIDEPEVKKPVKAAKGRKKKGEK